MRQILWEMGDVFCRDIPGVEMARSIFILAARTQQVVCSFSRGCCSGPAESGGQRIPPWGWSTPTPHTVSFALSRLFLTVFRCSSPPNSTLHSAESLASQQLPILVASNKEFLSREANYVNHPTQHHCLGQSWVATVYLPQSYLLPIAGRPRNTFDDAGSSDPPPMRGQFL